jgi:hypothetical protein
MVATAQEDECINYLLERKYSDGRDGLDGAFAVQIHHLGQ